MKGGYYYEKNPLLSTNSEENSKTLDSSRFNINWENRKYRDVIFGILFILMFVGMTAVNVVGFTKGNPAKLLPSSKYVNTTIIENDAQYWFQDSVAHLKQNVDILAYSSLLAFILGLIWIQLMRTFTKVFIYLTFVVGVLAVIAGGIYSLMFGIQHQNNYLKIFGYILFAVAFLIVVVAFFLKKKIELTCALFAECCKGVQHNPGLLGVGSIIFALLSVFTIYWVAGFLFLFSIEDSSVQDAIPNAMPTFNTKIRNLMYFNVFGFYWTTSFLSSLFQMSIAGAVASWYFSRDVNGYHSKGSPSLKSLSLGLSKSFGSLAFGSLIVAVLEYIDFLIQKIKKTTFSNKYVKAALCFIQCFVSCIQGIMSFVNRYAYIHIAMHGEGFCTSARNCYDLLSRNSFTASVVNGLGEFVLFVGKLIGTIASTIFAVFLMQIFEREVTAVTVVCVAVISFCIFNLFSNIVAVGVDTVLVCYFEDLERNKPENLYMDSSLHNKLQEEIEKSNN